MKRKRISAKKHAPIAPIPVIDVFAGPGGLGEGFSSLIGVDRSPIFQIKLSAEMEPAAYETLLLRAYYRAVARTGNKSLLNKYYEFCNGDCKLPYDDSTKQYWEDAKSEALNLTLGEAESDRDLHARLCDFASKILERPFQSLCRRSRRSSP